MPKISVIIPCYNYGKYLMETVDSVLRQTFRDFEIIIVNDGSTDEHTIKVIKEIKEEHPEIIIINQKNGHLANARNNGIKASKGEYILPLDSDDIIESTMLEKCYSQIEKDKKLGFVYTYVRFFGDINSIWENQEYNFYDLLNGNYIVATSLIRKKAWEEVGGYDEDMKNGHEDWEFLINIGKNGWFGKLIKEPLFCYRKHGESMIDGTTKKQDLNEMYIREKHVDIYNDEKISEIQKKWESETLKRMIILRDQEITGLNQSIQNVNKTINQKDQELQLKDHELQMKDQQLEKKDAEIRLMASSKFWKLQNRYVKLKGFRFHNLKVLIVKAFDVLRKEGVFAFLGSSYAYLIYGREYLQKKKPEKTPNDLYQEWILKNEKADIEDIKETISSFTYKPLVSIIVPVYNVDSKWLNKCIESVQNQFYENWELCLYDDASTKIRTIRCLKKWQKIDSRIKVSFGNKNQHISGASNEAIKLATGEFIALLDNDDELSSDALYENVKALNLDCKIDFIYSDEDKIDVDGIRNSPFFKPDWSPDLLHSVNYICHFSLMRKEIGDRIGWFRKGFEGAQDFDLFLRFFTETQNIKHIPKILYHWRTLETSTAKSSGAKNYAHEAGKKALEDFVKKNNIKATIEDGFGMTNYRLRYAITDSPLVSIIIPFRDEVEVLKTCVESIVEKTIYKNYELILVNNQSEKKETLEYLKSLGGNDHISVLQYDDVFNFSAINNFAAKHAKGEYVLFLNNDTEVLSPDWLVLMLQHAQRNDVGAVGAKLLFPNDTIQHAGVIMGLGIAGHAFKNLPKEEAGYMGLLSFVRNYSAVTGACLLAKKSIFKEVGGFDEKNLAIAYNDVDLCLKMRDKGYLIVCTPFAELYHYESLSRGNDEDLKLKNPEKYKRVIAEREYMQNKWHDVIENDPYYNPNLTRTSEDFGIRLD